MRATSVRHKFVDVVPDQLERETLYVSIPFATAAHLCLCGCGHEVVTPLSPTDWRLIFDGATVSLEPSIGNWSYPCQSHYWIRRGRVRWAPQWSAQEIERERQRDARAKQRYYDQPVPGPDLKTGGFGPRSWPDRACRILCRILGRERSDGDRPRRKGR